jgi:hypothetical protein
LGRRRYIRSNNLNLHGGRSQGRDLALHTVSNTRVHGGTTREDDVTVEILTDIDVTLHDGVVGSLVDTSVLKTQEGRLEESLRSTETFVTDGDDLTVRKFVGLFEGGGLGSDLEFLLVVQGNVAELLLDVTNDFTFGRGAESVTTLSQDLHEVLSQVTTGKIETENGVRESVTFVDGDSVRDTITRVQDDTGGTTRGVQGQDGLNGDVESGGVEGFEHDLCHLLTVSLGVQGSLSQEDGVLFRSNTEFVVEGVVPV